MLKAQIGFGSNKQLFQKEEIKGYININYTNVIRNVENEPQSFLTIQYSLNTSPWIGLIHVKELGWTGFHWLRSHQPL